MPTGYARVSTDDQDPDPQRDALCPAGYEFHEDCIGSAEAARQRS